MTMPIPPGVQVQVSQTALAPSTQVTGEGTAAFCLPYNMGPTTPVKISSWGQFQALFGSFAQANGSMLHHSVYQYFANGGSSCFVARVPNTDAAGASLGLKDLGLLPPAQPAPTTATTGGTVLAGVYKVEVTYVNANGETLVSSFGTVTTTGSTSTITIPSPPASGDATGWYAYCTQVGGTTYTRQQTTGSSGPGGGPTPLAIGTPFTIIAPPSSGGASPPVADTATDTVLTVKANSVGAWGNGVSVAISNANGNATTGPRFNFSVWANGASTSGAPSEFFPSVSLNPGDARNVAAVVNSQLAGSKYVNVTVTLPTGGYVQGATDPAFISATPLASGSDGVAAPGSGSTPTLAASVQAAFDTLQQQILWLNLPGLVTSGGAVDVASLNAIDTWADGRGDVMLVVDGPAPANPPAASSVVVSNYTSLVSGGSPLTADAAFAVYAPWLWVMDPSSSVVGAMRFVPPGGAVLAIWDRAKVQYGIQQAPAGNWATVATQSLEAMFTATDLQNLNNAQINAIKAVPNVGFCVYGARTLATGLPSRYVNVQRTLVTLTHDMEQLLSQFTFQGNDSVLWGNITNALTTYLTTQMQAGVLAGNTPASAFTVLCDSTINTAQAAQSGFVYVQVGVAINSPAEFLSVTLQLLSGSNAVASS